MKQDAKDTLLENAIEVFADHGYRDAKIADIVKRAKANIAAVNYHFGSKDQLFVAALRRAYKEADEVYPSDGGLGADASSREKITAIGRAILRRSFAPGKAGNFNRIMSKTIHHPSSPVEMIMKEVEQFVLIDLSYALAEYLETDCEQLISWAVVVFLSLATMISKCPAGPKNKMFGAEASKELNESVIEQMIEGQIVMIFAALDALPNQFPKS